VRSDLNALLFGADFDQILNVFAKSSRTLSALITFTYSGNPLICWRAIDAIGRSADHYSSTRPEIFRNYLQRLFWMMSDESGAVVPHAPEVIGEIVQSNTKEFADFIPLSISLLNLEPEDLPLFLPGILYALGRIGWADPGVVDNALDCIEKSLAVKDPQTRAMAVQCLNRLGNNEILLRHPELSKDSGKTQIYSEGQLLDVIVARLYRDALSSPVCVREKESETDARG